MSRHYKMSRFEKKFQFLLKTKNKAKILKVAKEDKRYITYRGPKIQIIVEFSSETKEMRRQWCDIVNVLKEKKKSNKQ